MFVLQKPEIQICYFICLFMDCKSSSFWHDHDMTCHLNTTWRQNVIFHIFLYMDIEIERWPKCWRWTRVFIPSQIYLENNFRNKKQIYFVIICVVFVYIHIRAEQIPASYFQSASFFKLLVIYSHFFSFLWFVFLVILNDYYIP